MAVYQEYVVGTSPVPKWLRGRIMPYKKMNGETGYDTNTAKDSSLSVTSWKQATALFDTAAIHTFRERK